MVRSSHTVLSSAFILMLWPAISLWGCGSETDPNGGSSGAMPQGSRQHRRSQWQRRHAEGGGSGLSGGSGGGGATGSGGDGAGGTGEPRPCPDGVICVPGFPGSIPARPPAQPRPPRRLLCAPATDESGPEVITGSMFQKTASWPRARPAARRVSMSTHLLQALDARPVWTAKLAGRGARPRTYWVTADTWVSGGQNTTVLHLVLRAHHGVKSVAMGMDARLLRTLFAFTAWAANEAQRFAYAVTDFSCARRDCGSWICPRAHSAQHLRVPRELVNPNDSRWAVSFSTSGVQPIQLGVVQGAETYTRTYGIRCGSMARARHNDNVRPAPSWCILGWLTESYVSYFGECARRGGVLPRPRSPPRWSTFSNGGLLLFHYPDGDWSASSSYLP